MPLQIDITPKPATVTVASGRVSLGGRGNGFRVLDIVGEADGVTDLSDEGLARETWAGGGALHVGR